MDKVTVSSLQNKKILKTPITALTCYDAFSGRLIDAMGVDVALVGDSLANTRLGYPSTIPVTLDEMIHHAKAARRGVQNALLVADMPFMSYELKPLDAARSAGRFIKEAGAQAVKVEGGQRIAASIKAMINANIPVMGHLGLTPQSIHIKGGYKVQGRARRDAAAIIKDALLLQRLGVFSMVLEGMPAELAKKISKKLKIPTIGIGAGPHCDGQILVLDDLLGMGEHPTPKFVKQYARLRPAMSRAIHSYLSDVRHRKFPTAAHSYR